MLKLEEGLKEGAKVEAGGWIASIRLQGDIAFIIIFESGKELQITVKGGNKRLWNKVEKLREHSAIVVEGTLHLTEKAPRGFEIYPKKIEVVGPARKIPPFSVFGGNLPSIDKRLDIRAVDLRRLKAQAIFRLRHKAVQYMRDFLTERGFVEVQTSKIISSATEGGAALFPIMYYDKEAFLAQSPQLYKEQLVMSFEKVFEVGPIFRAEPSRTLKHLSEATSFDVEQAFISYNEAMDLLEEMVTYCIKRLIDEDADLFKVLKFMPEVPRKMPRITYERALDMLKDRGIELEWGDDLGTKELEELGEMMGGFYFITDWPLSLKPFYIMPKGRLSESFDLMYKGLELSSGGTRIHKKSMLVKRLKEQGLKPKAFEYHLKVFDYGMPPHAGFGLGVDRFMMVVTGVDNIREVVLYPRDVRRLTP